MGEPDRTTRREFTAQAVMALLSGVTVTVSGCGSPSSSPSAPSGPPAAGGATASISANHGHVASITAAQITAGSDIVLQIRGTADHPHTVALSGPEVVQIGAGTRVSRTSSNDDGHAHLVTFN